MIAGFIKNLCIPLFALVCLASITIFIYFLQHGEWPLFNQCLCHWDCGWYHNIKQLGYVLHADRESNLAFFPLFPYLWRWLDTTVLQMSIINATIFCLSFAWAQDYFAFSKPVWVTFFCLGLLPFFMVPYSESLFFAGSIVFLMGLQKKNGLYIIAGIAISVMARSASMIFGVAFLILFIHEWMEERHQQKKQWLALLGFMATLVFTLLVFYIHYLKTGNFFAFFYAQQFWEHHAGLPQLPLTSWHWPTHISDSVALIFGLTSIILVIQILLKQWFSFTPKFRPFQINEKIHAAELFSLLYLAGTAGAILLFQGGNLHSLNRYVMATPFFIFLIQLFYSKKVSIRFTSVQYLIFTILIGTIFPRQTYIEHYILIATGIFILPASIFFKNTPQSNKGFNFMVKYLPLLIGAVYQIMSLTKYLSGKWMG